MVLQTRQTELLKGYDQLGGGDVGASDGRAGRGCPRPYGSQRLKGGWFVGPSRLGGWFPKRCKNSSHPPYTTCRLLPLSFMLASSLSYMKAELGRGVFPGDRAAVLIIYSRTCTERHSERPENTQHVCCGLWGPALRAWFRAQ